MIEVTMEFDSSGFERRAQEFKGALAEEVRGVMLKAGVEHDAEIIRDLRAGTGGLKLGANESGMRNSFKTIVEGSTIDDLQMTRFSDSKTAAAHEFGTTIRPKKARMLTIPLRAVQTKGGRRRGSARSFKDAHFIKKGSKLYLANKDGLLFVLVRQAVIPARPFFYRIWNGLADRRTEQLRGAIARAIAKMGGTP